MLPVPDGLPSSIEMPSMKMLSMDDVPVLPGLSSFGIPEVSMQSMSMGMPSIPGMGDSDGKSQFNVFY